MKEETVTSDNSLVKMGLIIVFVFKFRKGFKINYLNLRLRKNMV